MKIELSFEPIGGGETDYSMIIDLPAPPQAGDTIHVKDEDGFANFRVLRTAWWITKNGETTCVVSAEFADGPFPSPGHQRALEIYRQRKAQGL